MRRVARRRALGRVPLSRWLAAFAAFAALVAGACNGRRSPALSRTTGALDTSFPARQVLVVLRSDDASVLAHPEGDPVLRAVYAQRGTPQVTRAFPQLDDQSEVRRQVVRSLLVPYRIAQRRAQLGLREGLHTPPLHRFHVLTFPSSGSLPTLIAQLGTSPSVLRAYPNLMAKLAARPGQPYYEPNLGWFAPYSELLDLTALEKAALPVISADVGWTVLDKLDDVLPDLRTYYPRDPDRTTTHWQFRGRPALARTACQAPAGSAPRCTSGEVRIKFDDALVEPQELALLAQWGFTRLSFNADSDVHRVRLPAGMTIATAMAFLEAPVRSAQVLYAQPSFLGKLTAVAPDDPLYPQQWHLNANQGLMNPSTNSQYVTDLFAEDVWDDYTFGSHVVVAVLDSGVMAGHDDFFEFGYAHDNTNAIEDVAQESSWLSHSNFFFKATELDAWAQATPVSPYDSYPYDYLGWDFIQFPNPTDTGAIALMQSGVGTAALDRCRDLTPHGTMMSSLIGARTHNAYGMSGMSYTNIIDILPVAIATPMFGICGVTLTALNGGIAFAADSGASVVNMSLTTVYDQETIDLIEQHPEITFIASSGNDGLDLDAVGVDAYPCEYSPDNLVCVGAADTTGARASFGLWGMSGASNYGANVDFLLPGTEIGMASWNTNTQAETWITSEGTSASAALGSGEAALAISICPAIAGIEAAGLMRRYGGNLPLVISDAWFRCNEETMPGEDPNADPNEPPECNECDCAETCPYEGCLFSAAELACDEGGKPESCNAGGGAAGAGAAAAALLMLLRRGRRRAFAREHAIRW